MNTIKKNLPKKNLNEKIRLIQNIRSAGFKPILHNSSTLFSDTVKSFLYDFFGKSSTERFFKKYSSMLNLPRKTIVSNPDMVKYMLSDCFNDSVSASLMEQIHTIFGKRLSNFFKELPFEKKFDHLNKAEITKYLPKINSSDILLLSNTRQTQKVLSDMISTNSQCNFTHFNLNLLQKSTYAQLSDYDVIILDKPLLIFRKTR